MNPQELVPLENPQPSALFAPGGLADLLTHIEAEARATVPDATTAKGRKAIAGTAARVARSKTYLDGLGKDYVAGLKAQTRVVDTERRAMRERLDALKAEVRQPLTDWEQAEADRVAAHRAGIQRMQAVIEGTEALGSVELAARVAEMESIDIGEGWQEFQAEARQTRDAALYRLQQLHADALELEEAAARAEAERLEREERERREREERIAREAAENAKREAEARAREQAEQDKRQRLDAIKAQREAERRAFEAEQRRKREAAEAEEQTRLAAERATREERERQEAEQRAQEEERQRREADREHRAAIHREILADLTDLGLGDEDARHVIEAVARGQVPRLSIAY